LAAANGTSNRQIALELKTSRPTVILWRNRFLEGGTAALSMMLRGAVGPSRSRQPRLKK